MKCHAERGIGLIYGGAGDGTRWALWLTVRLPRAVTWLE